MTSECCAHDGCCEQNASSSRPGRDAAERSCAGARTRNLRLDVPRANSVSLEPLRAIVAADSANPGQHTVQTVIVVARLVGRIGRTDAVDYWAAQVAAGFLAALVAKWLVNPGPVKALSPTGRGLWAAMVTEALFTFALAYVVLNVATSDDHADNSFYGLAIGFTVAAGAFAVGGISGGAFNPSVAGSTCPTTMASRSRRRRSSSGALCPDYSFARSSSSP